MCLIFTKPSHCGVVGKTSKSKVMENQLPELVEERIEGIDSTDDSWGDYPIDDLLIRRESRTIYDIVRRIDDGTCIMNPEFQRDFIWSDDKQSKLIESVIMRIPLPVFYLAEDETGRMVVVDGLQRLATFNRFLKDDLKLRLRSRPQLNGKRFSDLEPKLQNRVEDCNLVFYIIDPKVPESARLDIFERVNSGVPLTRQQMRNSLFMGKATLFLKEEANTDVFLKATGGSLNKKTMRDREFVNRFCAFQILDLDHYQGDMDDFLAKCLRIMNEMDESELSLLSDEFRTGLANNFFLFGQHAFRKHQPQQERRNVLNAALWDVMTTVLSQHAEFLVELEADSIRQATYNMLTDEEFDSAITLGTNDLKKVKTRFLMARERFQEILGANTD